MKELFKGLPESVKETLKVFLPFIVIVVLFIILGKFGISKVMDLRQKISDSGKEVTLLTNKLSILQSLSRSTISNVALVTSALPGDNPSLAAVSQLKNIAAKDGVLLTGIKTGSSTANSSGLSIVSTNFQVGGPKDGVINFVKDLETIAPISHLNGIKMNGTNGLISASVTVDTYWAPFPSTIPTVTGNVSDLSSSEKQTLVQINSLMQPVFSNLQPSENVVNTAPFGQ